MSESNHRHHHHDKEQKFEACNGGDDAEDDEEDEDKRNSGGGEIKEGEVVLASDVSSRNRKNGVFRISKDFRTAVKHSFRKKGKNKEVEEKRAVLVSGRGLAKGGGNGGGCYVCILQPRTEEFELPDTPASDPNSEGFSFQMLRTLIESNDFYSSESNPHI